ncbi:MAG: carbohydrate kinase [Bacteroidota bacterium]
MDDRAERTYDCIAVGEALVDLISTQYANSLEQVSSFDMHPGGSPANLGGNLARLGRKVKFVGSIGNDGAGQLIQASLSSTGLELSDLRKDSRPSSLILVTKSHDLPAFTAYREADAQILPSQFPAHQINKARLFHTTAFGLSREPARGAIMNAARQVVSNGVQLSIDVNYAIEIWPDREEAQRVLTEYIEMGALVKMSEVDYERLFKAPIGDPSKVGQQILSMGAGLLCLTLGKEGAYLFSEDQTIFMPSRPIEVVDTTGAGDAFWAGFLHGWLSGYGLEKCGLSGRQLAEMKLTHLGPLPRTVELD